MIIDSLDGRSCKEAHSLSGRHAGYLVRNGRAKSVQKKPLEWMVVQCTVRIWHVQTMVARVEGT